MSKAASYQAVLDREFLEVRARLLEVAAALDRLDRADHPALDDPRMAGIAKALDVLQSAQAGRAERVQLIFSQPFDDNWRTNLRVRDR